MFKLRKLIIEKESIFDFLCTTCDMILEGKLELRERGVASTRELAYIWYRVRSKYNGHEKVSSCREDMGVDKSKDDDE